MQCNSIVMIIMIIIVFCHHNYMIGEAKPGLLRLRVCRATCLSRATNKLQAIL